MRISTSRSIGLLVLIATLGASAVAGATDVQLIQAVKNGDAIAVRALLGRDADVDARQGDGATALHWAAHLNDLEAAELLIEAGAAVDATNDLGVTPLWVATTAGQRADGREAARGARRPEHRAGHRRHAAHDRRPAGQRRGSTGAARPPAPT